MNKSPQIFKKFNLRFRPLFLAVCSKFLPFMEVIAARFHQFTFSTTRHELQLLTKAIQQKKPLPEFASPNLQTIAAHLQHLNQSIKYSQDSFQQIFHTSSLPMLLLTTNPIIITAVNSALLTLLGFSEDQILGHSPQEINIGIFTAQYQQIVQTYHVNQAIRNFELTIEDHTHRKLTVLLNIDSINLNDNPYFLASFNDITVSKETTVKLEETNEYYTQILRGLNDLFFILDQNDCFTFINKPNSFFLNHKPEALLGQKIWDSFPSLTESPFYRKYLRAISQKAATYFQAPSLLGDQWFDFSIYPLKQGASIFGRNITSQKQIVEALQQSNQQIVDIMDSIPEVFFFLDNNGRFIYVNKQTEKHFGGASVDLLGKPFWTIAPQILDAPITEYLNKAMSEQKPVYSEIRSVLSDKYFECHIYPSINGLSIYMHDITERKKLEEIQAKTEERYSNILNKIGEPIFVIDHEWHLTYMNQEMERFLNNNSETTLLGKYIWDILPDFTNSTLYQQLCRAKQEKLPNRFEEYYQITQSWIDFNIFYYASGLVVCLRDITLRKKQEEASATERELLLITLRSIGDGVIAANWDGQVILLNKTAEELTGWTFDEAVGLPLNQVFSVINDKTSEPYDNIVPLTIQSGETIQLENAVLVNRDYKELMIANSCAPIRSATGEFLGVVMVFQDITNKIKTEAELLKAHKIESIGVLAGGIAHDFNNFLAAILANIQLAALRLEKGYDIKKSLNDAIDATKKASELTKQLLTFSKGGAPIKKRVSVVKLLEETTNFHLSGSKVKPIFHIPSNLWQVEVDTGQFSQVVSNLVINAEQAMPNGGFLTVCAENIVFTENANLKPGKYVRFTFQDYGVGISEENLTKIFDPFFTTKKTGSGLGLATSYSIITQHGGYIDVTSKIGSGATFYIYLPAFELETTPEITSELGPLTGTGKILVMDDEAMIRNVVSEMLTMLGYQVTAVPDGVAALQLYQAALDANQPFAAVIMDLTIPGGMGGLETIGRLLMIDPKVKAIASSGYANNPVMADYANYGFSGVVVKPYKIEELSKTLNQVLQQK